MSYRTRPATMNDLQAVVDLVNRERVDQTGETATIPENLRRRWTQPGIDLARDTLLVVDADDGLAGYVAYDNTREPRSRPYANLSVDPAANPNEVGAELVRYLEARAREDIPSLEPDLRVTVLAWAIEQNRAVLGALAAGGFEETRRFYTMRIDLDPADQVDDAADADAAARAAAGAAGATNGASADAEGGLAVPGYDIRPLRDGEERDAFRAMDESFLDHYGHAGRDDSDESFERWRFQFLEGEDSVRELLLVAVHESGEIAGVSFCSPRRGQDEETGWVKVLGVTPAHRRRGLGEALLLESFAAFRRLGKSHAGLGVDASSLTNATRLYEKCGMHVHATTIQMGKVLREGREAAKLG